MLFWNGLFYYLTVTFLAAAAMIFYYSDRIARACFALIGMGILLILNEVKRNARITNYYHDCDFITTPPRIDPLPGPAAPGSPEHGVDDGRER